MASNTSTFTNVKLSGHVFCHNLGVSLHTMIFICTLPFLQMGNSTREFCFSFLELSFGVEVVQENELETEGIQLHKYKIELPISILYWYLFMCLMKGKDTFRLFL